MSRRYDFAHDVTFRRFEFNHVGAVFGEDLRAMRAHEHRGHVQHFDAAEWAAHSREPLFGFNLRRLHALCPLGNLLLDKYAELLRRRHGRVAADRKHMLVDIGPRDDLGEGVV